MNYDTIVGWIVQSEWLFFALWIAALLAAFAIAFPEPTPAIASRKRHRTHSQAL